MLIACSNQENESLQLEVGDVVHLYHSSVDVVVMKQCGADLYLYKVMGAKSIGVLNTTRDTYRRVFCHEKECEIKESESEGQAFGRLLPLVAFS